MMAAGAGGFGSPVETESETAVEVEPEVEAESFGGALMTSGSFTIRRMGSGIKTLCRIVSMHKGAHSTICTLQQMATRCCKI